MRGISANTCSTSNLSLLTYEPRHTQTDAFARLAEAFAGAFQACQRVFDTAEFVAYYYLSTDFDCALLASANRIAVDYNNGVKLTNLIYRLEAAQLTLESWWTRHPAEAHGVSVQVADSSGAKVAGSDIVLHHRSLLRQSLDLSALAPGDYDLKLILYNYETGASVPGVAANTGQPFERALDIGRTTKA